MCARLEVPVSGTMPTSSANRKTTWAGVRPVRRAARSTAPEASARGFAVRSEKPW